jgi:hypothetical protein
MDPTVLAWALARPAGDRWRGLADAFASGTTCVAFDGRTVEYRSLDEIARALGAGHAAENSAVRRPSVTFASFSRRQRRRVMGRLRDAWRAAMPPPRICGPRRSGRPRAAAPER